MDLYSQIEYVLFILAFLISIYIAFQEGFQGRNVILLLITFFILSFHSLELFPSTQKWFMKNVIVLVRGELLVEASLYLLLYIFLLTQKSFRRFLIFYLVISLVFAWFSLSTIQPINHWYPTYPYVLMLFGVLIGILMFYYEKLNSQGVENIFRNFWFWISAGLFISLSSEIPVMSMINVVIDRNDDVFRNQTIPVLDAKKAISLFYYLTYPIGILCRTKT